MKTLSVKLVAEWVDGDADEWLDSTPPPQPSCATCKWATPTSGDDAFPLQCSRFTKPGAMMWSEGYLENVVPTFGRVQWEGK